MSKIIEGLLYSESHEWVKIDGNVAIIGVSDFKIEMSDKGECNSLLDAAAYAKIAE